MKIITNEQNHHKNVVLIPLLTHTHWHIPAHDYLNDELLHRWIKRIGEKHQALLPWLLRSPELTPMTVKNLVYVPSQQQSLVELKRQISAAVQTIARPALQNV
ncbi:hypothetical protein TNCV_1325401 [Trichonephila clavipes]|nr:hypothetical protein TNCV_1325401 [Trichonephila clavipes]